MRRYTQVVAGLPSTVPFVPPEALERASGRKLRLRLGANESAFGASPRAREAMRAAAERTEWYGDPDSFDLRERLAALHGASRDNVVVGSGIDDLLALLARAFVEPGRAVVTSRGAYPTWNYQVVAHGGALGFVPYRDFRNDLDALVEEARRSDAVLLFLANPDNPTGSWIEAKEIASLIDRLPEDCLLILDEAYVEFAPSAPVAIAAEDPRVIRLRTFSKVYGMAGARIGYAVGERGLIGTFEKYRQHFGVNSVAQAGALASLDDPEFVSKVVGLTEQGRRDYAALGQSLGMASLPSATNFVAFDAGSAARAALIKQRLLDGGVFTRTPGAAPLDRLVRIGVGTESQRKELAEALRAAIATE